MNATTVQPNVTTTISEQDAQPLTEVNRTILGDGRATSLDVRELLVNDQRCGPALAIAVPRDQVSAIHAFMTDIDCKQLDPLVVGEECVRSSLQLYCEHVSGWLDRDPVLAKAEVRDTGGGLHVLLRLDEPIIVSSGEAAMWDDIAKGIRNVLPGDPHLSGIIAMTRPLDSVNTKYDPPRQVCQLRQGEPVTKTEILDLSRRVSGQPAHLWMQVFFGGERVNPCPLCGKESLGVAGAWQCRCYECGRINAAALVYRFYSPEFLDGVKEPHHG